MFSTLQRQNPLTQKQLSACLSMWNFDVRRLEIYRWHNPSLGIDIQRIGPFLALKFKGVGYFNRAIGPAAEFATYEDQLLEYYGQGEISFRLSLTGDTEDRPSMLHPGFRVADIEEYYARPTAGVDLSRFGAWSFEQVPEMEMRQFFQMYLQYFAGPNCYFEEALDNMEHLANMSGLHCRWVNYHGRRVGFGMWHWQGSDACLCGGGVLSPHRRNAGHQAILLERLRASRGYGCSHAVAVAKAGSEVAQNLKDTGFHLVWSDEALQWVGSLKRAKLVI
ncbi:MAG: hypothetical protein AB3N64_08160 [Puniceicoccaceae bacterium]